MSVYRELFVEVPLALLEAAVLEAQQRRPPLRERLQTSHVGVLVKLLPRVAEAAYGWERAGAIRLAASALIGLEGVSQCGHWQQVVIDERVAQLCSPSECADAIERAIRTQRQCYCLERPR